MGLVRAIAVAQSLTDIPLFENLTTRQLLDLARVVKNEQFREGETIIKESEDGDAMFVITEGAVEISKGGTSLGKLNVSSCFGEMAVFEKEKRSATVSATCKTKLLRIDGRSLIELMEEQPTVAISICQYLSERLNQLNNRIEEVVTNRSVNQTE